MAIPALMVFLSLVLPAATGRWANIVFGAVYTVVMLLTMPGAWWFYLFLGCIEIALSAGIVWLAWSWPRQPQAGTAPGVAT